MKSIYKYLYYTALMVFIFSCNNIGNSIRNSRLEREKSTVLIQPISYEKIDFEKEIHKTINEFYGFQVVAATNVSDLPKQFINYEKGFRYSAAALLGYLKEKKPDSCVLTLGLTSTDIYTAKKDKHGHIKKPENKYRVWGIMGLATRPGVSAVVSTKRLKTKNQQKYKDRLLKVVLHEIGHNLGLRHCEDKKCLMTDAVEAIKTIDNTTLSLCSSCTKQIGN